MEDVKQCYNTSKPLGINCKNSDECIQNYCNPNTKKCDLKADNITCDYNYECMSDYCNPDSKKCESTNKANGSSCKDNSECKSNYCVYDKCTVDPTTEEGELGSDCMWEQDCKIGFFSCYRNIFSDLEKPGKCRISSGGDCTDHTSSDCFTNYCNPETHVCEYKSDKEVGDTCELHEECKTSKCDEDNGICIYHTLGESCDDDIQCDTNYCVKEAGEELKYCHERP